MTLGHLSMTISKVRSAIRTKLMAATVATSCWRCVLARPICRERQRQQRLLMACACVGVVRLAGSVGSWQFGCHDDGTRSLMLLVHDGADSLSPRGGEDRKARSCAAVGTPGIIIT